MKTILTEVITPIQCNTSKEPPFTAALKQFSESVIEIIADYRDDHNTADFNARYRTMYNSGSSQTPRYMGLFGTRYNEGSIWADSVGGIFNIAEATKLKVEAMLSVDNGYTIEASRTGSVVKVNFKGRQNKCSLLLLSVDENNHFKQILKTKMVTVTPTAKTLKIEILEQYPNCKVVALLQDNNNYAPDLVDGNSWGLYEKEVFTVTLVKN